MFVTDLLRNDLSVFNCFIEKEKIFISLFYLKRFTQYLSLEIVLANSRSALLRSAVPLSCPLSVRTILVDSKKKLDQNLLLIFSFLPNFCLAFSVVKLLPTTSVKPNCHYLWQTFKAMVTSLGIGSYTLNGKIGNYWALLLVSSINFRVTWPTTSNQRALFQSRVALLGTLKLSNC